MKITMKSMLALMAGAMVLAACSSNDDILENINEQQTSALKPMTFTASMEGHNGGTRATIDGSHYATDKLYDIKWVAGDKISVFDGATDNNGDQEFRLDTGDGTTSGTFIGDAATDSVYYAIYPYVASSYESRTVTQADAEAAFGGSIAVAVKDQIKRGNEEAAKRDMTNRGISPENQAIIIAYIKGGDLIIKSGPQRNADKQFEDVVLPAEQTVAEGQCIDPKAMLMIAKSADASTLQFKNVCAYVKVTPQFDCRAIALRSKGSESLAGTITVDYNEGTPTATVTANGTNEVILTGIIKAGNTYYIAVLPGSLASGFTIEFLDKDMANYYARSTSKTLDLTRNNVTNLGEFATNGAWNIKTATSGTDADGHSWKLVSTNPMLKLATAVAGVCSGDANSISTCNNWGDNWTLPSKDDVQPLEDAKAVSYQEPTCNFSCIGVLKYMSGLSIVVTKTGFWLAETYDNDIRYILQLYYGTPAKIISSNIGNEFSLLYKYVGE